MTFQELKDRYPDYETYRKERQEGVDALPLWWAFNDKQFQEVLDETGASGPEDFYKGPGGSFYLKKDAPAIHAWLDQEDPLDELLKDYEWAKGAFLYEMGNHEYHINCQGDWDVMNCFTCVEYKDEDAFGYLKRVDWETATKSAYLQAIREFSRLCDENDWW